MPCLGTRGRSGAGFHPTAPRPPPIQPPPSSPPPPRPPCPPLLKVNLARLSLLPAAPVASICLCHINLTPLRARTVLTGPLRRPARHQPDNPTSAPEAAGNYRSPEVPTLRFEIRASRLWRPNFIFPPIIPPTLCLLSGAVRADKTNYCGGRRPALSGGRRGASCSRTAHLVS